MNITCEQRVEKYVKILDNYADRLSNLDTEHGRLRKTTTPEQRVNVETDPARHSPSTPAHTTRPRHSNTRHVMTGALKVGR